MERQRQLLEARLCGDKIISLVDDYQSESDEDIKKVEERRRKDNKSKSNGRHYSNDFDDDCIIIGDEKPQRDKHG